MSKSTYTMDLVVRVSAARFVSDTGWAAGISNDLKLLTSWTGDVVTWLLGALDLSSDTHAVAASVIFLPDRSGLRREDESVSFNILL